MSSRGRPEEAQAALVQCQGLGAIEAEKQVQEMILASASTSTSAEDEDDSVQAKISEIFDSPYVIIRGLTCMLYVKSYGNYSILLSLYSISLSLSYPTIPLTCLTTNILIITHKPFNP